MPHLTHLGLMATNLNPSHCAVLFDGLIAAGKMSSQQDEMTSNTRVSGSGASQSGMIIEHLDLSWNDIGESVEKLAQAYRYMPNLRQLELFSTSLNPSQCAVLFDAFIAAGKMLSQQGEMSSDAQVSGSGVPQSRGLSIENLGLSNNDIGESVDKLLQALWYMTHLTYIHVSDCGLDVESRGGITDILTKINPKFVCFGFVWQVDRQ